MPAPHRREDQSVIQRLLDEPHRFDFCQAVHLAVQWLGEHGVAPEKALNQHLRFRNSLSLCFPPSQIEALEAVGAGRIDDEQELAQALLEGSLQFHVTPTFMGFLGASGTLPPHYTERILAWQMEEQDEAPRAFLDMLSNRMLALFYEASCKYRVEHAIGDGKDDFLPLLLALAGFQRGAELINSDGLCDEAVALYAGVLQQRPVSSLVLARMLSSCFGLAVRVEEAIGHWNPMARHEQTSLGVANAALGENTTVGESNWRPDLRARVSIGPLFRHEFDRFLPGAPGSVALKKLLSLCGEPTVVYAIRLILRAEEVQRLCLADAPGGGRLGLDSFMVGEPDTADRADLRYDIRPMEPLRPPRAKSLAGEPGAMPPE